MRSMCKIKIYLPAVLMQCLLLSTCSTSYAQAGDSITIEQCYQWAQANYPLAQQVNLIERTKEYSISNISKGIYPQFQVSGQATYQSEVTKIPFPGIPSVTKDQYRVYGEVSQSLTDFPANKIQQQLKSAEASIQQENITVELYKLKDRINQLFFGALLIDEQIKQSALLKSDIQRGIKQTEASIKNGTAFHSSLDKLNAEVLKIQQHDIELSASRKDYIDMLSLFINKNLDDQTLLVIPASPLLRDSINRPELQLFALQKGSSLLQNKLINDRNIPKLNVFFQGGVGKPSAVNLLSTNWSPYYITGLRLNWLMSGLYSLKKEKLITENDRKVIDVQQKTFLFNTQISVKQQNGDIQKYLQLIETDKDIISLRESIKNTSVVQLENGVITTNDYLKEVNEEDLARQNLILHNLQLLMVQYAQKITTGN
ncbi:MAG: TolC family protein [Bacteroidota bacterium]|nr:TolC family protein [Bacteroidota bacterium]